jgi:quercetin dioxygenase-like cupin family protein
LAQEFSADIPTTLADLVQYQDGAVVSRALVKDKSGTVTLFAFDAGESLSEHETPYDALLYLLEGSGVVTIAGASHTLGAGQVIRLPRNVPHAVDGRERFKMLLIMIRSGAVESPR